VTVQLVPAIKTSKISTVGEGLKAEGLKGSAARSWTSQGRCVGRDPDELFVTGAAQRVAAKLCNGCPVRLECLTDALDNQVEFGVWGGLTERQRRALLRQRPEITSWRGLLEGARHDGTDVVAS
jgi:WhiB family redox-sensing transcriptional regulator